VKRCIGYGWCLLLTGLVIGGCGKSPGNTTSAPAPTPLIATSNSYLEAAVQDLLGESAPVMRLAEPGMCPGHFDIRPSQVNELRQCRLLLRFEFQTATDDKLASLSQNGLRICAISVGGGMCEPPSYLRACRKVADVLVEVGLLKRADADSRLTAIEARLHRLEATCKSKVTAAGWADRATICSHHQEAFCKWLGLRVAATFTAADTTSVGDIQKAIANGELAQAQVIIANLPEGRRVADALGQRLGVAVVVFGNFPPMKGPGPQFDTLVENNVAALLEAPLR
jgi:zinc transport system substrate-binding protein